MGTLTAIEWDRWAEGLAGALVAPADASEAAMLDRVRREALDLAHRLDGLRAAAMLAHNGRLLPDAKSRARCASTALWHAAKEARVAADEASEALRKARAAAVAEGEHAAAPMS